MSAAHTPGPWQRSGVRRKLGEEDCLQVGPDGFPIAFLPIGRRPNEQAGAIADANLTAAAPDLLEVARHIDAAYRAIHGGADLLAADHPSMALWAEARAAIAKATGEQS